MLKVLGLDVGGVHIKHSLVRVGKKTRFKASETIPFEIFRDKDQLPALLEKIRNKHGPDCVSLTMTGELSDVFRNRRQGVRWIAKTVHEAMANLEIRIMDVDGRLVSYHEAMYAPERVASANWAATLGWMCKGVKDGIVLDVGSTTTDILPIRNHKPCVMGKSDFGRLKNGELLYTGCLRTNASFVVPMVRLGGKRVATCPEHFAIIGDAHLFLGELKPKQYTTPTPDGRGKTKSAAAARLARLVLSEPDELGFEQVESIARQVVDAQVDNIAKAVKRMAGRFAAPDRIPVILIGPGRLYLDRLKSQIPNYFPVTIMGHRVDHIDPSSCAAALWGAGR